MEVSSLGWVIFSRTQLFPSVTQRVSVRREVAVSGPILNGRLRPEGQRLAIPQDCPRLGGIVVSVFDMGMSIVEHKRCQKMKSGASTFARLQEE